MSEAPSPGIVPEWTLGDRLGKALAVADVSAAEMAEYLDVHRNTISSYINDRVRVSKGTIRLWAMRTGVPMEWIESGQAGTQPQPTPPDDGGRQTALDDLAAQKRRGAGRGGRRGADYPSVSHPFPTAA